MIYFIRIILILFYVKLQIKECYSNRSLSVNITKLLDKLLMNYSKSLRPTYAIGF